jgi:nitroreductase|tara:strand:+ start:30421 stop:31026 length:606 start_codon:yes stop_codon:yes gene_type:complete
MTDYSNLDDLRQLIEGSQRAQRNWDLDKQLPTDHIKLLKYSIKKCPTKQNRAWYSVTFITNRDIIEQIYKTTYGFSYGGPDNLTIYNTQTLANMLVLFHLDVDPRKSVTEDTLANTRGIQEQSIGIASAYLNLTAHMLGYKTGFCQCFDDTKIAKIINKPRTNLILGIGFPNEGVDRKVHHINNEFIYPTFDKRVKVDTIE